MSEFGMIDPADVRLIHATDSVAETIEHIRQQAIEPFGLKVTTRVRRYFAWLGERSWAKR
jgi:hypothetical protein